MERRELGGGGGFGRSHGELCRGGTALSTLSPKEAETGPVDSPSAPTLGWAECLERFLVGLGAVLGEVNSRGLGVSPGQHTWPMG